MSAQGETVHYAYPDTEVPEQEVCAVPKSRVRKKPVYTPPPTRSPRKAVSPPWLVPTMLACLLLGLAWIALYYVTQASMPGLSALGGWNLVCGFALIVVGVVLATRWR